MNNIVVQQGKLVKDSSLVPFIRRNEVQFDADNLRPNRRASIFFDEMAVNAYCQRGNFIEINTKKKVVITPNTGASFSVNDVAWQYPPGVTGPDNFTSNTFSGVIESYDSGTKTLILNDLNGIFDEDITLFISTSSGSLRKASCNIVSHSSQNTADTFSPGEGVYCQNNNVYMTVIGTSGENIVYVNNNYLYCRVLRTGAAITEASFKEGDLVFQTNGGKKDIKKATFLGYVQYFKTATGANTMSIIPIDGALYANTNLANVKSNLFNQSNSASPTLKVTAPVQLDFLKNNILISTEDGNKKLPIVWYQHRSGVIANTKLSNGRKTITLAGASVYHAEGQMIRITSGDGIGEVKRIINVDTNGRVTVNSAFDKSDITTTTRYTLGNHEVDDNGSLCGIFNIPEEPNIAFKVGERIFTITDTDKVDSENFSMKASGKYTASGLLNTTQRISATPVTSPVSDFLPGNPVAALNPTQRTYSGAVDQSPVVGSSTALVKRISIADGLSQTFFVPKSKTNKVNRGIFVTSIDLFFKKKPRRNKGEKPLPILVKIAEVDNGYPTKKYIARSIKLDPKDVNISDSPSIDNENTKTKFTFRDPVYLEPDNEYALIVSSESPEYECYISELGGLVIGANPPRRISEQPNAGSLFKSQNASTWTPYQNQDLMFVINKAVFNTNEGEVLYDLGRSPRADFDIGKVRLHVNDLDFSGAEVDFFIKGQKKNINTGVITQEPNWIGIKPGEILHYGDLNDESTRQSPTSGIRNSRHIDAGNRDAFTLRARFTSDDQNISPVVNKETISLTVFQYDINDAELANTSLSIAKKGSGYRSVNSSGNVVYGSSSATKNNAAQLFREEFLANNYNIAFYNLTVSANVGSGADGFAVANTDGSNGINFIVMTSEGSGYFETPTITIAAPNDTSAQNEALVYAFGETNTEGGNIAAKYLTRKFDLVEGFEAGDLSVFMDAIKPAGTDIQVYYKVLGIDDLEQFEQKRWVRMERKVNLTSKNSKEIVELEYRPSLSKNELLYVQDGVEYPIGGKFKSFAVKVCLTSRDSAVVPYIRNVRISAVPAG